MPVPTRPTPMSSPEVTRVAGPPETVSVPVPEPSWPPTKRLPLPPAISVTVKAPPLRVAMMSATMATCTAAQLPVNPSGIVAFCADYT